MSDQELCCCDYCQDIFYPEVVRDFGYNFCTPNCEELFKRKLLLINKMIYNAINKKYEGKPE